MLRLTVIAASATSLACRDSDAPVTVREQSPSNGSDPAPLAEVVIARPAGRYQPDPATTGGAVTGTITTTSIAPGPPITTGRDSAVCGSSVSDESAVRQGNGLGGAVVWLDDLRHGKPLPIERRLELESDKCRLVPRVQGAVVGSAVNVIAHDGFRQHLRFLAGGEREPRAVVLLDQYEQVIPTALPFAAPGLVVVRDADHPWPTAYLAVFDHPYFAVTSPNGTFTIDRVPPGRYRLKVWHERGRLTERLVDVGPGGATVSMTIEAR